MKTIIFALMFVGLFILGACDDLSGERTEKVQGIIISTESDEITYCVKGSIYHRPFWNFEAPDFNKITTTGDIFQGTWSKSYDIETHWDFGSFKITGHINNFVCRP